MNDAELDDLLDQLVLRTERDDLFSGLSEIQKAVAALEFFTGTATRSGLSSYFEARYEFLFADTARGLDLIGMKELLPLYGEALQTYRAGKGGEFEELTGTVINSHEKLREATRHFGAQNANLLTLARK